ncbi:MAG TPA: histidine--tRNA ligase [Chloroflexota bacterium]
MSRFSTPTGTQDILPQDWPFWSFVMRQAEAAATLRGYRRIETPIFAETTLFARTSGEGSDLVHKEMYSFKDRDGSDLTLRPEGTAPVMRAYLQHGMQRLPQPVKLYYFERMYRRERPQKGRYREHRQFGCEALGSEDPLIDAEMIALLADFYGRVGIRDVDLHLNSIGDGDCRPAYIRDLTSFLEDRVEQLAPLDRDRLGRNPLRILDSKEPQTRQVISDAPHILEYLCDSCRAHWNTLRGALDALHIPYTVDPLLVRGLDYYTRTTFEFIPAGGGSQSTIGAGGRYDALSESIGGPSVPGVGFGSGIERIIEEIRSRGVPVPATSSTQVYVAWVGSGTELPAMALAEQLRKHDIPTEVALGSLSLKTQLKRADATGARCAVIVGEDELARGEAMVRDLSTGEQRTRPIETIPESLKEA